MHDRRQGHERSGSLDLAEAFGLNPPSPGEPGVMETVLQDIRLLATGKAPQRAAEVERDLDKADGMIRLLFNDVQTLKDGRHPQGEQMYRR